MPKNKTGMYKNNNKNIQLLSYKIKEKIANIKR